LHKAVELSKRIAGEAYQRTIPELSEMMISPAHEETIFFHTDTADVPWTVIKSDCKKRARLSAMLYVLHRLPYTHKSLETIGALDPLIVGRAHLVFETGERHGESLMH
jgi:hypothetical protein